MGVRGALRGLRLDAESNAIEFGMGNLLKSEVGMRNEAKKRWEDRKLKAQS